MRYLVSLGFLVEPVFDRQPLFPSGPFFLGRIMARSLAEAGNPASKNRGRAMARQALTVPALLDWTSMPRANKLLRQPGP
jgi:hypothetical protein